MSSQHTPGPWRVGSGSYNDSCRVECDWTRPHQQAHKPEFRHVGLTSRDIVAYCREIEPGQGAINARLIAAAPDHQLVAAALCARIARWEPFPGKTAGEVCVGGMRYSAKLDEFGVPALDSHIREALTRALEGCS